MSLSLLQSALKINGRNSASIQAWTTAEDLRASKVDRFRRYADGDHDNNMTTEMRNLLNQKARNAEDSHEFNDNLCAVILDTMLDRIQLLDVKASGSTPPKPGADGKKPADPSNEWIRKLLDDNRIDSLSVDVNEATLRDGNTYLMVDVETKDEGTPNEMRRVRFTHEPAYDGTFGMIVLYETAASHDPMLAIKVWRVTNISVADTVRVNVYYPDRIERFISRNSVVNTVTITSLEPYNDDGEGEVIAWLDETGRALGVPVFHFVNRGGSTDNFGLSELENVIPLQDALNGTMVSMVATTLLSGFPIRGLVGAQAPAAVAPGLTLSFYGKDANGAMTNPTEVVNEWLKTIRFEQFEVADLAPFIAQAQWLKQEMFAVTNTPTDDVAADASGEARKQSEVKLIGKVKRFCVRNGNAWEDAVKFAARVARAFTGEGVPEFEELNAEWADPEVRNDSKKIADVQALYRDGIIPLTEARRQLQGIFGWTDDDLLQMEADDEKARNQKMEDQANAEDAAMVESVLGGLKKKRVGEVVIGGTDAAQPAA